MSHVRTPMRAVLAGMALAVVAGCGGNTQVRDEGPSKSSSQPRSSRPAGATPGVGRIVGADVCALVSASLVQSIAGSQLPFHQSHGFDVPDPAAALAGQSGKSLGHGNACFYAQTQESASSPDASAKGVITAVATLDVDGNLDRLLRKGYEDLSQQFSVPSGYNPQSGILVSLIDARHIVETGARLSDTVDARDRDVAIALMRAIFDCSIGGETCKG